MAQSGEGTRGGLTTGNPAAGAPAAGKFAAAHMEENQFRQFLARHMGEVLDGRTLAKGSDYLRRGRVRRIWYSAPRENDGSLTGEVQGSAAKPYTAGIHIDASGSRLLLDTHCTCPMTFECKHVAAIALKLLGERSRVPEAALAPSAPTLGAWAGWMQNLDAPAPTASFPRELLRSDGERVFGLILRLGNGALPRLDVQPVWLKPGKRGGYVSPQPIEPAYGRSDPWQGLSPSAYEQVARLRMRAAPYYSNAGACTLADARDEALLETLLADHPCFFDKPSAPRLTLSAPRRLEWRWQQLDDGDSKLVPMLAGADSPPRFFHIAGVWYYDAAAHVLGRVDGVDPRLLAAAAAAPPLRPEQNELVASEWRRHALLDGVPAPGKTLKVETRRAAPTPVLTLRALPATLDFSSYRIGVLRLSFDYAGVRLPFSPAQARERRFLDGRVLDIVRDRGVEIAACERLDAIGLVDAETLPRIRGAGRDTLGDGDFVLERRRGQLAAAEDLFALAPRLREAGFRLESDDGFPFELAGEAETWYAELEAEGSGLDWFEVRLGVDIDGERVDLLPILRRLLADPGFPLEARPGEAADAIWLVPLDARRRAPLPLARLRALIAPLLEWLQGPAGGDGAALRLRRAQAAELAESDPAWRGGEQLRALFETLRAPRAAAAEPAGFRGTLRRYQGEGLAWLDSLADAGLGGVLADDMGLGKTVQVLAHLLVQKQRGRLDKPALIVAPTSLMANWREEAARFAPDLSVLVLHGPERGSLHAEIPRHDLVLTTYPLLPRDREALVDHDYALLVLDEAQAIKNAKTQWAKIVREIPARRRLAMTGTPLENHLGELWAQFDAVEPGLLGSEKTFTRFFRTPIEKHGDADRRERLKRRIAPLLLRRRKEDVLADLPPKTEIARAIELEGAQRELYETLRLAQHERVLAEVKKRGLAQAGIVVLDALLKLRQACCDPRLVKLAGAKKVKESAKLDLLVELVEGLVDEGRRILVFSQFAEMLHLIRDALTARSIAHLLLTGDTPGRERGALVKRFQNGTAPVFLISLKAGGVGLNLTAADTVIHYDPWWNPAVENQATDRAHRIGQDKPVFVYKLICAGTVEEKIQQMQQRKAELARAVLEGGDVHSLRFEEADLAELFAPI